MTPSFSVQDYLGALQALMPRGRVWPRDLDATQTRLLLALAQVYERSDGRSRQLLVDSFPQSAVELLPEWELTMGLPDSCGGAPDSIDGRQARLVVKLQEPGGMSKAYFLSLASGLGYADTTIAQFGPTHCEMSCQAPMMDVEFRFLWNVNLPHEGYVPPVIEFMSPMSCETNCSSRVFDTPWPELRYIEAENHRSFRVGSSCDDRIDSYLFGSLECQFMRLKPAHTHVIFTYRGLPDEAH